MNDAAYTILKNEINQLRIDMKWFIFFMWLQTAISLWLLFR